MPRPESPASPPPAAAAAEPPRWAWSARWRAVVSVLLVLHVGAVIVGPLSNPPPSSLLSQEAARLLEPYLAAADLNHGYRFFAPNPGASSLVRYVLIMPDGSREEGQFPSVEDHWPRLLYHRHFMISETINAVFRQVQEMHEVEQSPLPPEVREELQRQLAAREDLLEAIAHDLLASSGAERVELRLVSHGIADPELVWREGVRIDDARWYEDTPLGSLNVGESWTWSQESHELPPRLSP